MKIEVWQGGLKGQMRAVGAAIQLSRGGIRGGSGRLGDATLMAVIDAVESVAESGTDSSISGPGSSGPKPRRNNSEVTLSSDT